MIRGRISGNLLLLRGLELIAAVLDEDWRAQLLLLQGDLYRQRGDADRARSAYTTSLKICKANHSRLGIWRSHLRLGYIAYEGQDYPLAQEHFGLGLAIARERTGNYDELGYSLLALANANLKVGDRRGAERLYEEALEVARDSAQQLNWAAAAFNLGAIAMDHEDLQASESLLRQSVDLYRQISTKDRGERMAEALLLLAAVVDYRGDHEAAAATYAQAKREADRCGSARVAIKVLLAQASNAESDGDFAKEASLIEQARAMADVADDESLRQLVIAAVGGAPQ
jgi:tetratricopeptide (TPR) repeat protein